MFCSGVGHSEGVGYEVLFSSICGISVSLMVVYDCLRPLFGPIQLFLLIEFFGVSGFQLVLYWGRSR